MTNLPTYQSTYPRERLPVKTFSRFSPLPPGAIRPQDWLGRWAQINAAGWLLEYASQKDPGVYGKLWDRNQSATFFINENDQTAILCDYTAYFADGLMRYAQLCPGSQLAGEAEAWLEQLLASQDPDGYIGAFIPEARWQHWLEVFTQSLTLEAVLYRYECTGDASLLQSCERAVEAQRRAWKDPIKPGIFNGHGTIAIRAILKLYQLTGNKEYLDFAGEIMDRYGRLPAFLSASGGRQDNNTCGGSLVDAIVKEFFTPGDALTGEHNAVITEHIGFPAMLFEYTGDPTLLEASRAAWDMMVQNHLSVAGGPHGNEIMQRVGPRENCEHCGTVEWILTGDALARITGEVKYADEVERALFNAYPAAKSPDGRMVAYMHAPNQLVAAEWGSSTFYDDIERCCRQHYHSAHDPLCCNSNGPRGLPHFIESMLVRAGEGLAIMYYGPTQARTALPGVGQVELRLNTQYPFEDQVQVTVLPEKPALFPLQFRIPGWCSSAVLEINGQPVSEPPAPGHYFEVQRLWSPGDQVTLRFEIPLQVIPWRRSEFGIRVPGVVIRRGPLTYALPVEEIWQKFYALVQAPTQKPGHETISYRVLPAEDALWNYALVLDPGYPEASLTLTRLDVPAGSRPWEHPPVGLRARARQVLNWRMDGEPGHPMTPGLPYSPMQLSDQETTVTLVPFGFTHLRLTYLPFVSA